MLRFSLSQKMAVFAILFHINVCLRHWAWAEMHTCTPACWRSEPTATEAAAGGWTAPLRDENFTALLLHLLWKTDSSVLRKIYQAFFSTSFKLILSRIASPDIKREVARCVWFSIAQLSALPEWVQWWSLPEHLIILPRARSWLWWG